MQLCAISKPLFPNLKALELLGVAGKSISFIPLFLSPRTTIIRLGFIRPESSTTMVAPMVATFPILCPSLQEIRLNYLPMDPAIVAAVSGMLIANNRNTLRSVIVDSPLTEEAHEAIFKLPNLRDLSLIIERGTPLPSMVLPNLTDLVIGYDRDCDWLPMFQEATLGNWRLSLSTTNRNKLATSWRHSRWLLSVHPSRTHSGSSISTHHARGIQATPLSFHSRS